MSHTWIQIGTRDAEGYRTHSTPGDVCADCSDPQRGLWVPVSECLGALADMYARCPWMDREFDSWVDRRFKETRAYRM